MSQSNETKKPAARPSLLSAEQQVALEQHQVAPLAAPAASAPAPAAARRKPLWLAGGVAVFAAVTALAVSQFGGEAEPAPPLAAAPAPAAAPPAAAAPVAAPAAAAGAPAAEPGAATPAVLAAALDAPPAPAAPVQTATIVDEAPPPATGKPNESLAQMLESGATPAAKPTASKPAKKPVASKAAKPASKAQSSSSAEPDNDVELLAALVAHAKYEKTSSNARISLPRALEQCKKQGKQEAARCRIRVCEGRWKKEECRVYSRSKLEKSASGA
ncbi:hypothetical protein [Pseudoduganella sp.]|uniref:hypothetical protein n=1 Tax=Pseudoduganella sp. TaxID=1880898 RepID=UPI0035B2F7B0